MSKRAEEAALKAYPEQDMFRTSNHYQCERRKEKRRVYREGYRQAEKDLALTCEDIAFICQICTEVINSLSDKPCPYTPGFKDLYGEVLNRFNEQRNSL